MGFGSRHLNVCKQTGSRRTPARHARGPSVKPETQVAFSSAGCMEPDREPRYSFLCGQLESQEQLNSIQHRPETYF